MIRMMLLMLQAACIIATLVTNTVEAGAAPSSRSSSRGFECWGAKSGLLFSTDPYHNTDCDALNAKTGSGWICNGHVWPPNSTAGKRWARSLNEMIKGSQFYLYSKNSDFFYLASHRCEGDAVKLTNYIYPSDTTGLNVPEPFQPDGPPLVVVYVSTTGDDHASGTADSPLRSFGAARDMARTVSADRVEFASGTYLLNATQVLTLRDSGTASKPRTYAAAPGADVTFSGAKPVTGWRGVTLADAAYPYLDDVARAAVQVAPLVGTSFPSMLFDSGAERARLSERAVRQLPDTNVIYSLVPQARQNSETCVYLGQHDSEKACRTAALAVRDLWAYAWHDPTIITDPDFARGCYGRQDSHGSRTFQAQEGVMSGVFTSSMLFREFSEWEISSNVTTQHRCPGAECEYFDPETAKRTMSLSIPHLDSSVGNDPAALFLRIYLVDFAMNVLPVQSIASTNASSSTLTTAYPATLLLGQKPGYCTQTYDEGKCSPAIWLLNTMRLTAPGQYAVNTMEKKVYYWPAVAATMSGKAALDVRVSIGVTPSLVTLRSPAGGPAVEHIAFENLRFARTNFVARRREQKASASADDDAGGIQHNWAALGSDNALVVLSNTRDIHVNGCTFINSGGAGLRSDGLAQGLRVAKSSFSALGDFAIGFFGNGLGASRETLNNTIEENDISETALRKFDSPAIVLWNAAHTWVFKNYIHDTSARALYLGGSRYCAKPQGFATDGGIFQNNWTKIGQPHAVPQSWRDRCDDSTYAYTFADDCKCSFWRGAHGNAIVGNTFVRVTTRKDRPFFSDGIVYISGPGYVEKESDVTRVVNNTWIATPGFGPPSFRALYVDGYTGSMVVEGNAVDVNTHQGMMLCNWYGRSNVTANALALGAASWGTDFEIQINCDGNPVLEANANLILSDTSAPFHDPEVTYFDHYRALFHRVCAASKRSGADASAFLSALNSEIQKLNKKEPILSCSNATGGVFGVVPKRRPLLSIDTVGNMTSDCVPWRKTNERALGCGTRSTNCC